MLTGDEFLECVRDGLNHLYDLEHLRHCPLANVLGLANRIDTPGAVQRVLTDGIESLKPQTAIPAEAQAWEVYEPLFYRYVQRLSQPEIANQLGVSTRQVRRRQRTALEALAGELWKQLDLASGLQGPGPGEEGIGPAPVDGPTVDDELAWLKDVSADRPTDPNEALVAVRALTQRLADEHRVELTVDEVHDLPQLAVHPVSFRQMVLGLLGIAIPRVPAGRVWLSARPLAWEIEFRLRAASDITHPGPGPADDQASVEMVRQLSAMGGGRLATSDAVDGSFEALLVLPVLEQLPILAVDDNADTLQLLGRYTSGTRYRLVGIRDPEQATAVAAQLAPQVIVLDVMMPQVDGWEILGRLRQHPTTAHIPVVVCTILAQENLALSLGASGYVRKPVTRRTFLAALDHQLGQPV